MPALRSRLEVRPNCSIWAGNLTVTVLSAAAAISFERAADGTDALCRFCSSVVPARVLNSSALECVAPPALTAIYAPLSAATARRCELAVSLNGGADWERSRGSFWYYFGSVMRGIYPSEGPVRGGTAVTLRGANLVHLGGPRCYFGGVPAAATLDAGGAVVRCVPPAASAGDVSVRLSLSGVVDSFVEEVEDESAFSFRHLPLPTISAVLPLGGPAEGGSLLIVQGGGFSGAGARCRFGSPPLEAVASFAGGSLLRCRAPPLASIGGARPLGEWCASVEPRCQDAAAYASAGALGVHLSVEIDGEAAMDKVGGKRPWVYLGPRLHSLDFVSPWGGPHLGGTRVRIAGEGFVDLGRTRCRFGSLVVPASLEWEAGEGGAEGGADSCSRSLDEPISTSHGRAHISLPPCRARTITCHVPAAASRRHVRLSVSLDGVQWASPGLSWRYVTPTISEVSPMGGPMAANSIITITATNLLKLTPRGPLCIFGTSDAGEGSFGEDAMEGVALEETVAAVEGTLLSTTSMRCVAPSTATSRTMTLRISLNEEIRAAALSPALPFTYFDETMLIVSAISPARAPIAGATLVTVSGVGFQRLGELKCRFGNQTVPSFGILARAREGNGGSGSGDAAFGSGSGDAAFGSGSGDAAFGVLLGRQLDALVCETPSREDGAMVALAISLNGGQHYSRVGELTPRFTFDAPSYVRSAPAPSLSFRTYDAEELAAFINATRDETSLPHSEDTGICA